MSMTSDFRPQWASPPGRTIRDSLVERGLSVDDLARGVDMPLPEAEALLIGERAISIALARSLSRLIGGSVEFWITRDARYRDDSDRLAATAWLQRLPLGFMRRMGWIPEPGRRDDDRVRVALEFFGVSSLREWQSRYSPVLAGTKFRASARSSASDELVAAWLRRAELEAEQIEVDAWDSAAFASAAHVARRLSREKDPKASLVRLRELFAGAGVAVAIVRAPSGAGISGACAVTASGKRYIALSGRYLVNDHLWFTIMHEAAHLLLHDVSRPFVDSLEREEVPTSDGLEAEANAFAMEVLVPQALLDRLPTGPPSVRDVLRVSAAAGVAPGVVVGQMQYQGRIGFGRLNHLKRRYKWDADQTLALAAE